MYPSHPHKHGRAAHLAAVLDQLNRLQRGNGLLLLPVAADVVAAAVDERDGKGARASKMRQACATQAECNEMECEPGQALCIRLSPSVEHCLPHSLLPLHQHPVPCSPPVHTCVLCWWCEPWETAAAAHCSARQTAGAPGQQGPLQPPLQGGQVGVWRVRVRRIGKVDSQALHPALLERLAGLRETAPPDAAPIHLAPPLPAARAARRLAPPRSLCTFRTARGTEEWNAVAEQQQVSMVSHKQHMAAAICLLAALHSALCNTT